MLDLPEHACLFCLDTISFLVVISVFLGIKSPSSLPIFYTRFNKNDPLLMVQYQKPTISAGMMSISSHLTPIFLLCVLCVLRALQRDGFNTRLQSPVPAKGLGRVKLPPAIMGCLFYVGYFLYGVSLMAVFVILVSHLTGGLAPNFLAVCNPQYNDSDASSFTRDICQGDTDLIHRASLSFPSQYAAHLSFGFTFNLCIVYCIPQLRKVPLTQHLLMTVMIILAVVGSVTRFTDGYNRSWDVLAGLLIGTASALYFILIPLRLFGELADTQEHIRSTPGPMPNVTFDQLSALPYTDLQSEQELNEQ